MQFKPFVAVILLFVAQSIAAECIVAQSPGSGEYPSPSIPDGSVMCTSNAECPPGQHCCGISPDVQYCLPIGTIC
ncbi:ectomycorrhiza-regulated small secreted protein [Laccaria bicolor S238N-H82]|uniref:Ectomycorrhiza-regulated small secreted protein n=1 Tax=Laccaria bicolor (strain S238N-H82 / ATCC MYA-4686) TaxID=486041 RepID=B0DRA4_LACBS|nr:ectomycorrhiza-regulated small secreted protein [Laccaria bicolor S238N-H82]EDR02836.1 ectomycorrhiza-regulated small secreted protein [Laccaria bicolor S238N-H82]|eukprot:XP_001886546.1 ectomycorrhiza-regulated small secreted protein [Laccaria bicolor S238N-H82]